MIGFGSLSRAYDIIDLRNGCCQAEDNSEVVTVGHSPACLPCTVTAAEPNASPRNMQIIRTVFRRPRASGLNAKTIGWCLA